MVNVIFILLLKMVGKFLLPYFYENRPCPPMICQKARRLTDPWAWKAGFSFPK